MRHPQLGTVCGVVVTYRSGPAVVDGLVQVEPEVDHLLVVDNGSDDRTVEALRAWAAERPHCRALVENGENLGLAAAQNAGFGWAVSHRADWILLLDHDSRPEPGMVAALARAEADYPGRYALLAPRIHNAAVDTWAAFAVSRGGWRVRRVAARPGAILDNPLFVIASGSLIRATALPDLEGMREDFFIDYVDIEFCLRLRAAGRRIGVVGPAVLHHNLGALRLHRVPGFRPVHATNHSPFRYFMMARNRTRMWREWARREPGWVLNDMAALIYQVARVALFEADRAAKLAAIGRGVRRGLFTAPEYWTAPKPA